MNGADIQSEFSGLSVLVTGGTKGIGAGIARGFLGRGAHVLVCGRSKPDDLPEVSGKRAVFKACDVRNPEECQDLVDEAVSLFGGLHILVNNAGGSPPAEASKASPRFSAAIINLNLI